MLQPPPSTYNSPYNAGKQQTPQNLLRSQSSNPTTPKPQKSSGNTTGWGTRWTPTAQGQTPGPYVTVSRPEVEPISPIPTPAELPQPVQKTFETTQKVESPKVEPPKSKPARRGARRARAGSTASSVVAGSHRSQSVTSNADELSLDEPIHRLVKQEVDTPRAFEDPGDTNADDSSAQAQLSSSRASKQSTKRKRGQDAVEPRPSHPPTHVLWTRNFPKISAFALESIIAHRLANIFSSPVTLADYGSKVFHPQDLKSIRSAINAGHRAAAAACPEDANSQASNVWLPISEDLIPPKAIINYSQLEKELMRMFANAVMYNDEPTRGLNRESAEKKGDFLGYGPPEDTIVEDTRAMFTDVERIVESLRAAERKTEDVVERDPNLANRDLVDDNEMDELAGDGDHGSGMGSVAKRRRKN